MEVTTNIEIEKENKLLNDKISILEDTLSNLNLDKNKEESETNELDYSKILYYSLVFNQNIDYLPCSLLYIYFGDTFNMNIDNLPSSIKQIYLGKNFSKKITNIPFCLEKIKLDKNYYDSNKEYIDKILFSNSYVEICF